MPGPRIRLQFPPGHRRRLPLRREKLPATNPNGRRDLRALSRHAAQQKRQNPRGALRNCPIRTRDSSPGPPGPPARHLPFPAACRPPNCPSAYNPARYLTPPTASRPAALTAQHLRCAGASSPSPQRRRPGCLQPGPDRGIVHAMGSANARAHPADHAVASQHQRRPGHVASGSPSLQATWATRESRVQASIRRAEATMLLLAFCTTNFFTPGWIWN